MLGPLQWGGHEEQEGSVHAMNGGQVTSAAGTEPCFGLELGVLESDSWNEGQGACGSSEGGRLAF